MPDNLFGVAADSFTHTVSTAPWSFMQRQTQLWIKEKLSNEKGFILDISLSRCTVAFVGALNETKKSLFLDSPSITCLVENAENSMNKGLNL